MVVHQSASVFTFGETAYRIGLQLREQGNKKISVTNFMHPKDNHEGQCVFTMNEEDFKEHLEEKLNMQEDSKHCLVRWWRRLTSRRRANVPKIVIVAGLGGRYSSKYAPMAARVAASMGYEVVPVVQLPFKFEGAERRQRAEEALRLLRGCSQKQLVWDHSVLSRKYKEMDLSDYFRKIDEAMLQAICEEM